PRRRARVPAGGRPRRGADGHVPFLPRPPVYSETGPAAEEVRALADPGIGRARRRPPRRGTRAVLVRGRAGKDEGRGPRLVDPRTRGVDGPRHAGRASAGERGGGGDR